MLGKSFDFNDVNINRTMSLIRRWANSVTSSYYSTDFINCVRPKPSLDRQFH
jgi:hypothetical protein